MYLVHEVLQVASGRTREAERRLSTGHKLMKDLPGFQWALVCRYLGNASQHLALRLWESQDAAEGWGRSRQAEEYRAARPEGLYTAPPDFSYWEQVLDTPGNALGSFLVRTAFDVDPARWGEFVDQRRLHDAAGVSAGGIVYLRTYRSLEDPRRGLVLGARRTRDDFDRFVGSGQMAEWRRGVPEGLFSITGQEFYEIMDQVQT